MDFPRWLRWCLLVFLEEALVGFLGTRDMMTQFWPAVAPFLTILAFGSGLAALSMFFDRWMADYKKWRREQTAQQQEALRQRQAYELRRRDQALRRLYDVKKFLRSRGEGTTDTREKFNIVFRELKEMGLLGGDLKEGNFFDTVYTRACQAETYLEEFGCDEAIRRIAGDG